MCTKLLCLNPVAKGDNAEKSKGSHNEHPNNQSHSESEMAITLCYRQITNFSAMNPCQASGKPVGNHFVLSQINTLHCQQKELEQRRTKVAP